MLRQNWQFCKFLLRFTNTTETFFKTLESYLMDSSRTACRLKEIEWRESKFPEIRASRWCEKS